MGANDPMTVNADDPEAFWEHECILRSDLAKFCLPEAVRDPNRKYAWANSICFLFLAIGLIGLKSRPLEPKPVTPVMEVVPVVFTSPAEEQQIEAEPEPLAEPESNREIPVEIPQVATVVAAHPAAAAFVVPVEGPVLFVPAQFAAPPPVHPPSPPRQAGPPKTTEFRRTNLDARTKPEPPYPQVALERHQEGKVTIHALVDTNGIPAQVTVRDSSGYSILDRHAQQWVKNRWRWDQGETRSLLIPFEFQIR
ncbi:MAG: TonB family protein [Verrucomicrobiales bacterium]|nr:TonB family protein [Verrucomicrobiales bacterium]